jgi:hypothetical protein
LIDRVGACGPTFRAPAEVEEDAADAELEVDEGKREQRQAPEEHERSRETTIRVPISRGRDGEREAAGDDGEPAGIRLERECQSCEQSRDEQADASAAA